MKEKSTSTQVNLIDLFFYLLAKWYWFALAILVCVGYAYYHYAKTPLVYRSDATVIIKDPSNTRTSARMGNYSNLINHVSMSNEILQLQTKQLMGEVVRKLDADINYSVHERLRDIELYDRSPVKMYLQRSADAPEYFRLKVRPQNASRLQLDFEGDSSRIVQLGDTLQVFGNTVVFTPTRYYKGYVGREITVTKVPVTTAIGAFRKKERREGFIGPLPEGIFEFGDYECELVDSPEQEGRCSYANPIDIQRTVDSIKEALFSCEAVVVMLHTHEVKALDEWEADYFVEEFAHACIDAGACALIGSGTHQLKGIEIYKDCPIIYGLGNFMFENEYVQLLPADYMEAYHLPLHGSAADGIATRSAQAAASLYTIEEVYQTVIPRFEVKDGRCANLELYPMTLGKNLPRHLKNIPQPADREMSEYITSYLNNASKQYGVSWKYDGKLILPA